MTTARLQAALDSVRDSVAGTAEAARALAGSTLVLAGMLSVMGILTAEATYGEGYSTNLDTISHLATRTAEGDLVQPSATIFNLAMVLSGGMLLVSAYALHHAATAERVTRAVALLGAGTLGVGVFPEYYPTLHRIAAGTTFVSGGVGAILVAQVTPRPFSMISGTLGVIVLVALDLAVFGGNSFGRQWLGSGGIERWVAYPVMLWQVGFGGYLLGNRGLLGLRHPRG
ncbi:MAG: DUF998 domain-containing protein [Dehalococcoidia bacterium]